MKSVLNPSSLRFMAYPLALFLCATSITLFADEKKPESDDGFRIKVKRDKDAEPTDINIRFVPGYKKTDLENRPVSDYKRSVLLYVSPNMPEDKQIELALEKCKAYREEQKKHYLITFTNEKTGQQIRKLSCSKIEQQASKSEKK